MCIVCPTFQMGAGLRSDYRGRTVLQRSQEEISYTQVPSKEATSFTCPVCGKEFRRPDALKEHRRTHTGEKPYQCPGCSHSSANKSNLNKHIYKYHPDLRP